MAVIHFMLILYLHGRLWVMLNGSKFDATRSSTPGGIFGGQVDDRPRGNVQAINRVKGRMSNDFLERLAIAEERLQCHYVMGSDPLGK